MIQVKKKNGLYLAFLQNCKRDELIMTAVNKKEMSERLDELKQDPDKNRRLKINWQSEKIVFC